MACKQTRFHLKQITTGTDSLKKKQGIAASWRSSWVGTVDTRKGVKEVVLFAGNTWVLRFKHILAPLNIWRLSTCLQSRTHSSTWLVLMKNTFLTLPLNYHAKLWVNEELLGQIFLSIKWHSISPIWVKSHSDCFYCTLNHRSQNHRIA